MDRRLGALLPHQLANPTRATPRADCSFPSQGVPGISGSFPPLSPAPGHIPTRYSPVRRSPCGALDLHVLGLPPAFVLSQDQTLRLTSGPIATGLNRQQPVPPSRALAKGPLACFEAFRDPIPRYPAKARHRGPDQKHMSRQSSPDAEPDTRPKPSTQPSIRTAHNAAHASLPRY